MATGQPLPMRTGTITHGANSAGSAPAVVNSTAPVTRCRIGAMWANSTSAVWTTLPAGWSRLYDATMGGMRCQIVYCDSWNPADASNVSFGLSSSLMWSANLNDWEGMAGEDPIVGTPVTASGAAVTSMAIPALTVGPGLCGMWYWAARYTAGASSRVLTQPADLTSAGNITPSGAAGIRARCGIWTGALGGPALALPAGSTGIKTATLDSATSMAGWSGIAFAVRAADLGGQFAAAA